MPATPRYFDPLSTPELTRTIRRVFEEEPVLPLPPDPFDGWGLYAIYYVGDTVELYRPLVDPALKIPVYVGRARRTSTSTGAESSRTALRSRLAHHAESISGGGLPLGEFGYRALLMDDVHINMGEGALIGTYGPVWNSALKGFGSNEPGQFRQGAASAWDTVHPGRGRTAGSLHRLGVDALTQTARERIAEQVEQARAAL